MKHLILISFLLLTFSCAQKPVDSEENYDVVGLEAEDQNVALARQTAQDSLQYFTAVFEREYGKGTHNFFIKSPFKDREETEHMWTVVIAIKNQQFVGVLDNVPVSVKNYTIGDTVAIAFDDVEDFIVYGDSTMIGNYLGKLLDAEKD
jgi:uncharacterized protein YegJ (DUF2314 family)